MAKNSEKTEQVERLEEEKSQVVDPAQVKYARQQFQKMMLEHLARDMARAGKFHSFDIYYKQKLDIHNLYCMSSISQ
jgi:hypothetical protein